MAATVRHRRSPTSPSCSRPLLEPWRRCRASGSTAPSARAAIPAALLEAGAERVIGVDRDPLVFEMAQDWAGDYGDRLRLVRGHVLRARRLRAGEPLDGVVLDLGVVVDAARPGRARLFLPARRPARHADGRRRGRPPPTWSTRRPRRSWPTSSITTARSAPRAGSPAPSCAARRRRSTTHARSWRGSSRAACRARSRARATPRRARFQALRIAVNDEFGELVAGLEAAERALKPGGRLAVVTFHSLEDRMVKRFLQPRSRRAAAGAQPLRPGAWRPTRRASTLLTRKAVAARRGRELAANPRARSARLRVARAHRGAGRRRSDRARLGLPNR